MPVLNTADKIYLGSSLASAVYAGSIKVWPPAVGATAPTYFGSSSNPADNGSNLTQIVAVTPPASMLTGDLAVVITNTRTNSLTWVVSATGGQTWNSQAAISGTNRSLRVFWCRFNGTWSADPSFDASAVPLCSSAQMHVFRPYATTRTWAIDTTQASATFNAPASPFTVTRTGLTTTHGETVTLAFWVGVAAVTWGSIAGTGWTVTGGAQYRNLAGNDHVSTYAHHLDLTAATIPDVSKNESGAQGGHTAIVAWYAS